MKAAATAMLKRPVVSIRPAGEAPVAGDMADAIKAQDGEEGAVGQPAGEQRPHDAGASP